MLHAEFSEGPFLLRRYAISCLTSAQALSVRGAATSPQPEKRLFAMANPTATGAAMPASLEVYTASTERPQIVLEFR